LICVVCPTAFRPDQVRASFVRCFASLLYTYRRYLVPASGDQKKAGLIYHFKMDEFIKNQPGENVEYLQTLQQTQGMFNLEDYNSPRLTKLQPSTNSSMNGRASVPMILL
jgi:hypothetical protein